MAGSGGGYRNQRLQDRCLRCPVARGIHDQSVLQPQFHAESFERSRERSTARVQKGSGVLREAHGVAVSQPSHRSQRYCAPE